MIDSTNLAGIVVLGLVVYRLTRVVTRDSITDPLRKKLYAKVQEVDDPERRTAARYGYTLVTCPWCFSVWCSFIVVALYCLIIDQRWLGWDYLVVAVAVAGATALMTAADMRMTRDD